MGTYPKIPIPDWRVKFLDNEGRVNRDWYNFLKSKDMLSGESNTIPSFTANPAETQEALGMAGAALVRQRLGATSEVVTLPPITRESQNVVPIPQPRITLLGNGVWVIQDAVANIGNYPTSLHNPGFFLATDTSGSGAYAIYRSDGTGWTLMAFISDTAYDATTWNGVTAIAPSQNAVRDKLESLAPGLTDAIVNDGAYPTSWDTDTTHAPSRNALFDKINAMISDAVYGVGWNGVTDVAPSKNAVYDKVETLLSKNGVNFGPAAVASVTVVDGQITAIS